MARKQLSEEERLKIKDSLIATRERRRNQIIKVIELKVNCHQTSKDTLAKMHHVFTQAKWIVNDMLALSETQNNNIFKYNYLEHKEVSHFNQNNEKVTSKLDLHSVFHRGVINQKLEDIRNLHKAKSKGLKVGKLKFKSEINSIDILTGPWIKIKDRSHISIPSFPNLKVYGLKQLEKYTEYELANAKFIRKPSGFYIHISVCIPKENNKPKKSYKEVGLDFGIKDNIITSDGEKFNCNVRESEQLKFLQKQLHRKQKGSKRYYRLRNQIQREYEHLSNQKTDASNKLMSYFLKNYDMIYFQDENLSGWKKKKRSKRTGKKVHCFSFGRQVQASYLGRVKAKLVSLEGSRSFKISRWSPTTKFCPNCGCLNEVGLEERVYECVCGYSCDRDVHAARNVRMFGSTKRAECLEQASAETLASAVPESISDVVSQVVEAKNEGAGSLAQR